jgi:putative transposase
MSNSTIQLAYKYRLYPNKPEIKALEDTFETCRQVYNSMLNNRKYEYEVNQKSVSYNIQQNYLPSWKPDHEELSGIHSQVLQNVVKRVELAFQAFFRRVKEGDTPGYPRHKGKNQYKSITYPGSGFDIIKGKLHLSKIGDIAIRVHRPIIGQIKTCTITKKGKYHYAKWYVSFTVEQPIPSPNQFSEEELGIDVGIIKFVAFSNGDFIENPIFFRQQPHPRGVGLATIAARRREQ